jgi:ribosome recycling factor
MQFNFKPFEDSLRGTKDWLTKEYSSLHTGAASPMVLDGISVDSYGTRQPVKNVASISIEDPKTLRVVPWDKSQLKEIEKEILKSDLGLSVATDDAGLRVIFPMLTTETRERLVKVLKTKLEDARVTIRKERENNLREIDRMAREGEMSEDEKIRNKERLQSMVDDANASIEGVFNAKEAVVMGK